MEYIKLIIMIAIIRGRKVVRRLIRHESPIDVSSLDEDVIGWINLMATCDDHAIITHYAKVTF